MNISSIFSQIFGQAADRIPIDNPEIAQAVRLVSKMQMHLQGSWRHAQHMGIHCEQHAVGPHGDPLRCVEPMAGTCVACRKPVCLFHAGLIPENGDLICFGCVGVAQRAARQAGNDRRGPKDYNAPPSGGPSAQASAESDEKLRRKHMRRLKLTGDPTEADIRAAFKREAAKAHPDKAPADQRDKAHEKFVALGEARDWLLANLRKRAA